MKMRFYKKKLFKDWLSPMSYMGVLVLASPLSFAQPKYIQASEIIEETTHYTNGYFSKKYPKEFQKSNLDIKIGRIDNRLKLSHCDKNLTFEIRSPREHAMNGSVKVSCDGTRQWSIYVAYTLNIYKEIVIAANHLPKGHRIRERDLEYQRLSITELNRPHFESTDLVVNLEAARKIQQGAYIHHKLVRQPDIVNKGDQVTIVAKTNGFEVSTTGIAMNGGAMGEQVRVKNSKTNKVISATVAGEKYLNVYGAR